MIGKKLVFRIRKKYFDAIVSGEKTTEFRNDSVFWRKRIDRKGVEGESWIAVFICGLRVHRREITLIQKIDTPRVMFEKDISTAECYAIHLGRVIE